MREGWSYKKLGELATFINGYPFKPSDWKDCGRRIIRIQNLNNPKALYNYYDGDIDAKYLVSNGDVLISWSGSLGVFEWSEDEAILNQHIFKVVFNKGDINKRFFEYVVSSRINEMKTKVHGITMQHITKRDFDVIPIPIPPLSEQQRIVNELDLLSSIIEKKKAQLKEYDQLAQSIFYDMFGDSIENPKGWEVKKMQDVCSHIVDCPHSTPKKVEYNTLYPCIRTSELKGGTVQWDTMQYLDEDEYKIRIARLKPLAGDIVFGREGSIGEAVILPNGYFFSLGQRTMLLRANSTLTTNVFLHRTILSEWVKRQIDAVNVSSTVAHVNIKDFKLFDIPLPPLSLQQSFAEKIEAIEKQKSLIQQSIAETQTMFDYTMDKYFG